jgi:hypothetical protein
VKILPIGQKPTIPMKQCTEQSLHVEIESPQKKVWQNTMYQKPMAMENCPLVQKKNSSHFFVTKTLHRAVIARPTQSLHREVWRSA